MTVKRHTDTGDLAINNTLTTPRTAIKPVLLAALATLTVATSSISVAADKELVISVYGFAQDAFTEIVYKPFEAQCNCYIVVETGNSVERLAKLEARKNDPQIDMAVMSTHDAPAAHRKGITQAIDVSRLSNDDKLYDIAKDPLGGNLGVGYSFFATSIVYRTD